MNPRTLMRVWAAFEQAGYTHLLEVANIQSLHTLQIAGATCLWPGALYRARDLGYLVQTAPGLYRPTTRMMEEVRRVKEIQDLNRTLEMS